MRDRFTRGLIAGIIAGIAPFIINFGAKFLNISNLVWSDFLGKFLLGKQPDGIAELVFTITVQFLLLGVMGIFFAFLLPLLSSQYYLLKGAVYGSVIWFCTYSLTFIFQLPGLEAIPINTAITHLISGILWGLALGIVLNWLDDRHALT